MFTKHLLLLASTVLVAAALAACSTGSSSVPPPATALPATSEPAGPATQEHAAESDDHHILIAYFTWAENTVVEDPSAVDVDATTSASVLMPGNAGKLADWIWQEVGGDLYSIRVTEPYSSNYDECLARASEELAGNARPELAARVENMNQYDTVFIGFPNWWYTIPMAVHTFLEEYDFSGKTIVPFVTYGTGGFARTLQDLEAALPDSVTILDAIGVYRPEVDESQPAVKQWLQELGY